MTTIYDDNIQVNLQIGTEGDDYGDRIDGEFNDDALFWDVVDIEVELSQVSSPNYVKGKVIPKDDAVQKIEELLNSGETPSQATSAGSYPNDGIARLVGSRFRLEVINQFDTTQSASTENSVRTIGGERVASSRDEFNTVNSIDAPFFDTDSLADQNISTEGEDSDTLLFDGRLANISPVGTNVFEIIAYDPGQQAFNAGNESGSILNQRLFIGQGTVGGLVDPEKGSTNNVPENVSVEAIQIIEYILGPDGAALVSDEEDVLGGDNTNVVVQDFVLEDSDRDSPPFEKQQIKFNSYSVTVKEALNRIKEVTNTEWWFDKDGTFYFGDPAALAGGVSIYETKLITDTSAGITTPPYQSVKVIGSGIASEDGWASSSQIASSDSRIVKTANIALPSAVKEGTDLMIELNPETLIEPTFRYINAEIATDEQAQNTAVRVANELIKQQASGKVTVVGFPEVVPFDGILMPNTENQPMGGQLYDVYAVKHRLNPSDGFKTEIEVAGPNPRIRGEVTIEGASADNVIASDPRDIVTRDPDDDAFSTTEDTSETGIDDVYALGRR